MKAIKVAVTNHKGGQGKTTMATHIAGGLAARGYRVLLIDTDSQGHASVALGLEPQDNLYYAMAEKAPLGKVIVEMPQGTYLPPDAQPGSGALFLLAGHRLTHRLPVLLEPTDTFLFAERVYDAEEQFDIDVVVIDTTPTFSMFDGSVYLATDAFLFVVEMEHMALKAVAESIESLEEYAKIRKRHMNLTTQIAGIVPNKLRAGTNLHRHNVQLLVDTYGRVRDGGLVCDPITLRTIWPEANNYGELVYTYAPSGQEAADAWDKVTHIEGVLKRWLANADRA